MVAVTEEEPPLVASTGYLEACWERASISYRSHLYRARNERVRRQTKSIVRLLAEEPKG